MCHIKGDRVKFKKFSNLEILTISGVTYADEGSFFCEAHNWAGIIGASFTLILNAGKWDVVILSMSLPALVISGYKNACRYCIFPFTYKNKNYTECTSDGNKNGGAWCATEVNAAGNYQFWMDCPAGFKNQQKSCLGPCQLNRFIIHALNLIMIFFYSVISTSSLVRRLQVSLLIQRDNLQ